MILFLIPDVMSDDQPGYGGLAMRYQTLLPLVADKQDIAVASFGQGDTWQGHRHYPLPRTHRSDEYFEQQLTHTVRLADIVMDCIPDVVVICDHVLAYGAVQLCMQWEIPYVFDANLLSLHAIQKCQKMGSYDRLSHYGRYQLERAAFVEAMALEHASLVTTCSTTYADVCWEYHMDTYWVPNAVDPALSPQGSGFTFTNGFDKQVLFVGRCAMQKGVELFTQADFVLPDDTALTITATDTPSHDRYQMMVDWAKQQDNVFIIDGGLHGADKAAAIAQADVVVMPSLIEPWGIVADEVALLGTPLICSQEDGLAEHTPHAHWVDVWQGAAPLSEAIATVLANPSTIDTQAAKAHAQQYTAQRQYQTWRSAMICAGLLDDEEAGA